MTEGVPPKSAWIPTIGMLGAVVASVALLEYIYSSAPVPPGVDPGDWITRSGAYVGLPIPPAASFGGPYIYPPLLFPFLGVILKLMGSPVSTGFVAGGLLLFLFGVSLIPLARQYLSLGPVQVAFVGSCAFSATLLFMLIWGAYPNFLAFLFLNLVLVVVLRHVERPTFTTGLAIGALLGVLYLTHSLTFVIALGTIGLVGLVAAGTMNFGRFKLLLNRGLFAGLGILVGVVAAYSIILRIYGIVPPDYLFSNPSALVLDNVGQLFTPLSMGPMFFPAGSPLFLPPMLMVAFLVGTALILVLTPILLYRIRGITLGYRISVSSAALATALATPALGYLAGIGTDYPRFVYFLPVPFLLLVSVLGEAVINRIQHDGDPVGNRQLGAARRRSGRSTILGYLAVVILLILLATNVTFPAVQQAETTDTGNAHSQEFLAAANWLAINPQPGSVITLQGDARWIEAITGRGAYDVSNTWLDFETFEIVNAQSTYWALSSRYAVTNGAAVESYTPPSTPLLSQSPMYSVYDEGVAVPVLRILPGALSVGLESPDGPQTVTGNAWGPGLLTVNSTTGVGTIGYANSWFQGSITSSLGAGGAALINLSLQPAPNVTLSSLSVNLGSPPPGNAFMRLPTPQSVYLEPNGRFSWTSTTPLGQLAAPITLNTSGQISPTPTSLQVSSFPANLTLNSTFQIPSTSRSFDVSYALDTPGTGNPGVALPRVLDSEAFLQSRNIGFLFLSVGGAFNPTIQLYQSVFGFTTVYSNSEWVILERR